MPPDPFGDEDQDRMAIEMAEALVRDATPPADHRWEHVGGEPDLDDFDEAEFEAAYRRSHGPSPGSSLRRLAIQIIAALVVIGLLGIYVLSLFQR